MYNKLATKADTHRSLHVAHDLTVALSDELNLHLAEKKLTQIFVNNHSLLIAKPIMFRLSYDLPLHRAGSYRVRNDLRLFQHRTATGQAVR